MKLKLKHFALILLIAGGYMACRRDKVEPDIKTYDQEQIQNYIAANGITGMVKDTSGGDTTGIWYKIITPGSGPALDYPDSIDYVYTLKTFDNKYGVFDTILNHVDAPLGHTAPNGLMLALHNDLKYKGTKMRLLVPSHLAYGVNGAGSGSVTVTNGRIAGNQCLDYTINVISNQAAYDEMVIVNYIKANNLSGYAETADGLWYKITKVPTGANSININSSVTLNYTGALLNHTYFDTLYHTSTTTFADISGLTPGFLEGLLILGRGGSAISMIVPSRLGYGATSTSGTLGTIPANSCLKFEVTVTDVTTY
jgi:FKBP-type peptidyl-prolyl cis-trans isomerase FkpA